MNILYARQALPKSIFLAGPTPRSKDVPSWRPEALKHREDFEGDSPKNRYLDMLAARYHRAVYNRLDNLCTAAIIAPHQPFLA